MSKQDTYLDSQGPHPLEASPLCFQGTRFEKGPTHGLQFCEHLRGGLRRLRRTDQVGQSQKPVANRFEAKNLNVMSAVQNTGMMCEPSTDMGKGLGPHGSVPVSPAAQGEVPSAIWPTLPSIHPYHWLPNPQNFQSAAWCPPAHTGRSLGEAHGSHTLRNKTVRPSWHHSSNLKASL